MNSFSETRPSSAGAPDNPATPDAGDAPASAGAPDHPATPGLKRWLQARDGTCRFPGCGVNVQSSQIDHTQPWAHGGNTEHTNLEHLCPKHHRFKTLGHWKARQPEAGTIEWTSPLGRSYRTTPMLA